MEPAAWGTVNANGARDCNDIEAAINVEATDTWYDGIDSNCDQQNDFDKDGDNTLDTVQGEDWCSNPANYIDYYNSWAYQGGGTDGVPGLSSVTITGGGLPQFNGTSFTCDPSTPQSDFDCEPNQSAFYPGAVEILGDAFDGDCDGDVNRSPLFGEPNNIGGWTNPGSLIVSKNDYHYIISTTVEQATIQGNSYEFDGVSLFFDHDAGFLAEFEGTIPRDNGRCSSGISASLDVATTSDGLYFANGCQASLSPWLRVENWQWSSGSQSYSQLGTEEEKLASSSTDLPEQIDIELDPADETWHVWANGGLGIHLYSGDMNFSASDVLTNDATDQSEMGFIDIGEGIGVTCETDLSCSTYDLDLSANTFSSSVTSPTAPIRSHKSHIITSKM